MAIQQTKKASVIAQRIKLSCKQAANNATPTTVDARIAALAGRLVLVRGRGSNHGSLVVGPVAIAQTDRGRSTMEDTHCFCCVYATHETVGKANLASLKVSFTRTLSATRLICFGYATAHVFRSGQQRSSVEDQGTREIRSILSILPSDIGIISPHYPFIHKTACRRLGLPPKRCDPVFHRSSWHNLPLRKDEQDGQQDSVPAKINFSKRPWNNGYRC